MSKKDSETLEKIENKDFEIEPTTKCEHKNKFSYNHGYHTICKDCGEELD